MNIQKSREFKLSRLVNLIIISVIIVGGSFLILYVNNSATARIHTFLNQEFDTDIKVTDIILQERYRDMLEGELETIKSQIKKSLEDNKTLKSMQEGSLINFSNKIDIAFIKPIHTNEFYDMSFSAFDTTPMIDKIIKQGTNIDNSVAIVSIDNLGELMLGSKKIVNPTNGRVLGKIYAGILFNKNFTLLGDIEKLTGSVALMLFSNQNMISQIGANENENKELREHIIASAKNGDVGRYKNYVYATKTLFFNNKPTDLKITFIKSSTIFKELKEDSYKSMFIIVLFTLITIIAFEILIKKLLIKPLERLHLFAKSDIRKNREYRFEKTPIKEINEIGTNLQKLIITLQKTNKRLQKRVDEEIEKVREKDRIIHSQSRQNALTELIVNLAHQWRQPLNVIALNAINLDDIIDYEPDNKMRIKKLTKSIIAQTKELSGLITEFTVFYERKDNEILSIHQEINNAIKLLPPSNLNIINNTQENLKAKGDAKAFIEVVSVIIKNSNEVAFKRDLKHAELIINSTREDEYIYIEFKDNCGGIEPEIRDKIFEPYTTTNFKSRNRGLGLFMAQNLANHGLNGIISAKNSDSGALFTLKVTDAEQQQPEK